MTGFGLLGHLLNIADASRVTVEIDYKSIPFLPGVADYIDQGFVPGGTERNLEALGGSIAWPRDFQDADKLALADAQTSGGLAIAVSEEKVASLQSALEARGVAVRAEIGRIAPRCDSPLVVL